jgi:outer membrane protein OmpA-like peptidoglycan-associated protein/tetratricopeptide (TPR) repeat protein
MKMPNLLRRVLLLPVLCGFILQVQAGGGALLEIADDLYGRLAFTRAAGYYERYLDKNPDDLYALYRLASCYKLVNNYEKQAAALKQLVSHESLDFKEALLDYAQVLQVKGDYTEAVKYYLGFLEFFPDDRRAHNQMRAAMVLSYGTGNITIPEFEVEHQAFNTEAMEYAPLIHDNVLYYTTTRTEGNTSSRTHNWTGGSYSDLLSQQLTDSLAEGLPGNVNTPYNDGPFTTDPRTGEILYTRNNTDGVKKARRQDRDADAYMNLRVYIAGADGEISSFAYNADGHNTGHAAISPDGNYLVFVSDRPGGRGQRDLYICARKGDEWAEPLPFGEAVNTEGDELFPAFDKEGNLYFASDGLGSIGGLDIFTAVLSDSGTVGSVERLGRTINSPYDDFGICFADAESGYFSSDRPGGTGSDDIYHFRMNTVVLKGRVVDAKTGEPIPSARVKLSDDALVLLDGNADGEGRFECVVRKGTSCELFADAEYYHDTGRLVNPTETEEDNSAEVIIALDPVVYTITVVDRGTGVEIPGVSLEVEPGCHPPVVHLETGLSGSASIPVYKACTYTFKAKTDNYTATRTTWTSPAEDRDEKVIVFIEEVRMEEVIVLNNIYYDYDKADLRMEESARDLQTLYEFLHDNPELLVRINSHTDARGTDEYNMYLSQRRAQSVVNWLIGRGISGDRLESRGFGESELVNNCADGIPCSEKEHQMNRRTEFQVIGKDGSTEKRSDPRDDIGTMP